MREFIFRGKREDSHSWIRGSLIKAGKYCCILHDDDGTDWDYPYLDPEIGTIDGKAIPVYHDTLGQYTGRLDKFGSMVYEGDILQTYIYGPDDFVDMGGTCVVLFDVHDQAYVLCNSNDVHDRYDDFGNLGDPKYYQVIGNIYDNPELLKGENNG